MANFKGEASERTWLISILKRKIIDHYRKINSNKGKAGFYLLRQWSASIIFPLGSININRGIPLIL